MQNQILLALLSIIIATNLKNTLTGYPDSSKQEIDNQTNQIIDKIPPFSPQSFQTLLASFWKLNLEKKLDILSIQYLYILRSITKNDSLFTRTLVYITKSKPHYLLLLSMIKAYCIPTINSPKLILLGETIKSTFIMVEEAGENLDSQKSSTINDENDRPVRSIISCTKNLVDRLIAHYQSNQTWDVQISEANNGTILHYFLSSIFYYSIDNFAYLDFWDCNRGEILKNILKIILICGAKDVINNPDQNGQTPLDFFLVEYNRCAQARPKSMKGLECIINTLQSYGAKETTQQGQTHRPSHTL